MASLKLSPGAELQADLPQLQWASLSLRLLPVISAKGHSTDVAEAPRILALGIQTRGDLDGFHE